MAAVCINGCKECEGCGACVLGKGIGKCEVCGQEIFYGELFTEAKIDGKFFLVCWECVENGRRIATCEEFF